MAIAKLPTPDTYHGLPVLALRVGDPIPTPRVPERYAVRVYPDLARYLLTFNHPHNRTTRTHRVRMYANDMVQDWWMLSPHGVVFSRTPLVINGQHQLTAVTEYGADVWMIMDFGWPDELIYVFDRNAAKTNADTLRAADEPSAALQAAIVALVEKWQHVRDTNPNRGFSGITVPSSQAVLNKLASDPTWLSSARLGERVYKALDKGLSATVWAAAHHIIAEVNPVDDVTAFFIAVADGTGAVGSPSRMLADYYRRRPVTASKSGDNREPLENIIRGWNAHKTGRHLWMVKRPGFGLSPVR